MAIENLPIFCYYDKQRFTQVGPMDCANWYGVSVETMKKKQAMYPCMGRKHITLLSQNKLVFDEEPRQVFKTISYFYVVVGTRVFQIDRFFNQKLIGNVSLTGSLWFAFLAVDNLVYAMITDETNAYVIIENATAVSYSLVTDANMPVHPTYVAAFGSRFVVSSRDTPNFSLTQVNMGGGSGDASNYFTPPVFNRASGVIGQMGVLHTQLYIFCDYVTDIWANILSQITVAGVTATFPWKLNTSYNWDYGIADPFSLDIDFGRMTWLARNANGLVSFMASTGQQPQDISSQAINVLLENSSESSSGLSPFIESRADGFLYQYENTVFYRVSAGHFADFSFVDLTIDANCIEYNFETETWHRAIELNGERNRIQKHTYFSNMHLVTVQDDPAMYEMAGNIYHNELRNPDQENPQAADAFKKYPMRYELITQQIFLPDYAEFIDDYVQIDFVFGDKTFYKSTAPFLNTVFIVSEESTTLEPEYIVGEENTTASPVFIVDEEGNTPQFDDNHYYALFKPHIELYYSNDGGVTFLSADLREFSQLGQYRWIMRWNELGTSRNRCYKLVCVSSAPIVILGAVRSTRRASGGAN